MTRFKKTRSPGAPKATLLDNPAIGKAAAALAAYEGVKQLYATLNGVYHNHIVYTVTVEENDHAYSEVHAWVLELLPSEKQRALVASTIKNSDLEYFDSEEIHEKIPKDIRLSFNDRRPKTLSVNGHKVKAVVKRVEDGPVEGGTNQKTMPMCIEFSSRTKAGQAAVLEKLQEIQSRKSVRQPVLRLVNQWGHWTRRSDLPLRDMASVILPKTQKDAITEDLREFLQSKDEYERLALPWHRGYMFHGPPGTGKTSLVKALANEFKLDLWYVSLGDLKEEAGLINLLGDVSQRSILLLEDIDTISLTHDRADAKKGNKDKSINLSSLLNALDGVATPHGLITIMTTNHFDKLDPALTRAGRMDRVEELTYPTATEVNDMFRRFYDQDLPGWEVGDGEIHLSQAELSEAFKRNLHKPDEAAKAVLALINGGTNE